MYNYGFGFDFGWILMVLFWILIIWVIASLFKGSHRCVHCHGEHAYKHSGHRALAILKERYAKGEITKEQFEEIKHNLS